MKRTFYISGFSATFQFVAFIRNVNKSFYVLRGRSGACFLIAAAYMKEMGRAKLLRSVE